MSNVILVIGANSDIAKEVSKLYLKNNSFLYLLSSNEKELQNFENRIFNNKNIKIDKIDYNKNTFLSEYLNKIEKKPDTVLIANGYIGNNLIFSTNELRKILSINFIDVANNIEQTIKYFLNNKINGKIAVITSVAGIKGRAKNYIYGSAKSALITYLSGLRQKYHSKNISITTIILGFVNTKMLRNSENKTSNFLTSEPKKISINIFNAIQKRQDLYFPIKWRLIMAILKIIPENIFKKLKF